MSDVRCPKCQHEFDVWDHKDWKEGIFGAECPGCGVVLAVQCEAVEYSYEVKRVDEQAESGEFGSD